MKRTFIAVALATLSIGAMAAQVDRYEDIDPRTIRFGFISDCQGRPRGEFEVAVAYDEHCWPVQYFPINSTASSMRNVKDSNTGAVINYYDRPNTRIILK